MSKATPAPASEPVFDPSRDHGVIMHGELDGFNPGQLPKYHQDGNYFRPDKSFHSVDGVARRRAASVVPVPQDTLPGVDESEVDELLTDPRAEKLMGLTRDHLVELVTIANGPVVSGEESSKMMVAWLCKNTEGDIAASP